MTKKQLAGITFEQRDGLADGVNTSLHYHASDRDRANHTGTQAAATISDFDTEVANNTAVQANTAKVSADGSVTTHNDVTSAGSGAIITSAERINLGNQSGTNTGDQDLSGLALKSNVLELDNTAAFTPDADYEPATKKYVDDLATQTVRKMEIEPTSNIENLDVSSLSPSGVLFVNNATNRELRSLADGIDGDIIHLVHLSNADLKIKDPDGYTGQQIMPPGDSDRIMQDYGGCILVYSATLGQWVVTGLYY